MVYAEAVWEIDLSRAEEGKIPDWEVRVEMEVVYWEAIASQVDSRVEEEDVLVGYFEVLLVHSCDESIREIRTRVQEEDGWEEKGYAIRSDFTSYFEVLAEIFHGFWELFWA